MATERRSAGRRVAQATALRATAFALALGCVDTDTSTPAMPEVVCDELTPAAPPPALEVFADLGPLGFIRCSGVAVSPRVVLTSSACLVLPPELDGLVPVESNEEYRSSRSQFPEDMSYDVACRTGSTWSPLEDGSFRGRLEEPVARSMLDVTAPASGESSRSTGVRRIFRSGAASRCGDAIAALVLNDALPVAPSSVRLVEASAVGESVSVNGIDAQRSATLQAVTADVGDATAPPRALSLTQQTCPSEHGAGVFSEATGALLGIVNFGIGTGCSDPEGRTIAARLSAFQRLLFDAALEAGDALHIEPGTSTTGASAQLGCTRR
jgi:hypothetical protein